jgi:CHAD domain-containing protein
MSKAWPVSDLRAEEPLIANAQKILRVRVAEYYSYTPIIDCELAIEPLHALRISAKRLRYTLELFRDIFDQAGIRNIERVKAIQESLGNVHDIDVRISLINDELMTLASEQLSTANCTLATSPEKMHRATITSALRPPPDDPRRGLYTLLSVQYADRHQHFLQFNERWRTFEAEGMRGELVALSVATRG